MPYNSARSGSWALPTQVPAGVEQTLADQLQVSADGWSDQYTRPNTVYDHQARVLTYLEYIPFDARQAFRLTRWLYAQVVMSTVRPSVLFDLTTAHLVAQRVVLPGVRRGVVELFVATEPLRGWRYLSAEADHKAATWGQFVARQMDTTYRAAKKGRWVMANLSTYKLSFFHAHFPPAVAQAYLQRMEIIYTPAHGSWLNMAELEFSVLSRQVLGQPFTSVEQVRHVVGHWQARQNAQLKPRNWQYKTADARIKLAKLYPTI